jgi:septal ring factor EnvC (AmiA/AmiB activator)
MTQTEREIQQIKQELATVVERVDWTRSELASTKSTFNKVDEELDKLRETISTMQTRLEVVAAGFEEFKKRWDESDRRRWTVYGVLLAASLTFVANLVLLFLKR